MLVLKNVSVNRGNRKVLTNINLRVEPGELVCVTGKSGSGKSTILELLAGLRLPTSGTVEVDGMALENIPPKALELYRRRLGVVFEGGKLLPYRTVAENVAFPLEIFGAPDEYIAGRVKDVLKKVDLAGYEDDRIEHLSADEKMRVAVARAIVHKPLIVLADEPTALLDAEEAAHVRELLQEINKEGASVIVFTHSDALAESLGGRSVALSEKGKMEAGFVAKKAAPKNHDVFDSTAAEEAVPVAVAPVIVQEERAEPVAKAVAPEPEPVAIPEEPAPHRRVSKKTPVHNKKAGGRKIRVTSIHSD